MNEVNKMNKVKKIKRRKVSSSIYLLSLFFCCSAFSSSFSGSSNPSNPFASSTMESLTQESLTNYISSDHSPFPISKVEETYQSYFLERQKMSTSLLSQKIIWELSGEDIFIILNFKSPKNLISKDELDFFYMSIQGTFDSKKVIDFIKKHKLSSEESLIFLIPIIRERGLSSPEIFNIIKEIKLSPNTKIHYENLLVLLEIYESRFESLRMKISTVKDYKADYSERRVIRLFRAHNLKLRYLNEKHSGEKFHVDPKEVITSLAHIITATRNPFLIEELYNTERFNPNALDSLNQTPLHSLFLLDRGDLSFINHLALLVKEKKPTDFMSIENLPLGEFKSQLKKLDDSPKNHSDVLLQMDVHPLISYRTSTQDWMRIFSAIQKNPKTNFNAQDLMGMTPLAVATRWGFAPAVKEFVKIESVDLSVKDRYNRSLAILSAFPGSSGLEGQSLGQKEITNLIIKKGGGRKQQVVPSFFNNYLDENLNIISVYPLNPLKRVLMSVVEILPPKESSEIELSLIKKYYDLIELYQNTIPSAVQYYRSDPKYSSVYSAIEKDDVQFFIDSKKKDAEIMHILNIDVKATISEVEAGVEVGGEDYILYNLLLHAIVSNSPKVVKFMLQNLKKDHFFTPSVDGFVKERKAKGEQLNNPIHLLQMDPLSEAFLTSNRFYLENRGDITTALRKNRRIINMLLRHKKIDLKYINFVDLSTIEMAIVTGNLFAVEYLHEKKGIALPESIWDSSVEFHELARKQSFLKMAQYILEKTGRKCEMHFH